MTSHERVSHRSGDEHHPHSFRNCCHMPICTRHSTHVVNCYSCAQSVPNGLSGTLIGTSRVPSPDIEEAKYNEAQLEVV